MYVCFYITSRYLETFATEQQFCTLEMKFFITVFAVFGFLRAAHLEDLTDENDEEQNKEIFSLAATSVDVNETIVPEAVIGVSLKNNGLSSQNLSEIHDMAKNISHSKGIFKESEGKSHEDLEIRRSLLKKVAVASESDAMKAILETFDSDENKLQLLEQMEFLVHQYDVAVNFATQGGLQIITPLLFSSDDEIVSSVASVLGAAMQSNPVVQKAAMKYNVGKKILKLLSHKSPVVLSRSIFALACYLRNAPNAQEEFINVDGVSKLVDIMKNDQVSTNTKLKIINLFSDLAVELQTAKLYPSDQGSENFLQFERLFAQELQEETCKLIPSFLDFEDFDTHQKIVTAMTSLHNACHSDFKSEKINGRLNKLLNIYDPDFNGEGPLYPTIDKDLKRSLHNDLIVLVKKINEEASDKSIVGLLKSEL